MGEVVFLAGRQARQKDEPNSSDQDQPISSDQHRAEVRVFPGARQLGLIEGIAAYMATLGEVEARNFLVFHFEVVELSRLVEQGISNAEIDSYIFTTARAIWARVRKIQAGAA
jgi:hypothetical protein